MKKRVIAILAVLCVCISFAVKAEIYIPDDASGTAYENDYRLLRGLGIWPQAEDGGFRPDAAISRGAYAEVLANLIDGETIQGTASFQDVTKDSEFFPAVEKLTQYGVIHGDGNGIFRPDELILPEEAIKMLVTLMGYGDRSMASGGYPAGFIKTAAFLGLDFPTAERQLSNGRTVELIARALHCPVSEQVAITDEEWYYSVQKDKTLLSQLTRIFYAKGIVTATEIVALDGGEKTAPGHMRIGEGTYQYKDPAYLDLAGYMVDCYFRKSKTSSIGTAVYVQVKAEVRELSLQPEEVEKIEGMELRYYTEKGQTKTARLSEELIVLYNGVREPRITEDLFAIKNGFLQLVDNDRNGTYEVARIWEYENWMITEVSENILYDRYEAGKKIDLAPTLYDSLRIYDADGSVIRAESLKPDSVVSVYASSDGLSMVLVQSTETVKGKINMLVEEDGYSKVKIGEKEYSVEPEFEARYPKQISIGMEGTFYLDAMGKIFSFKDSGSVSCERIGYLIQSAVLKSFEPELQLKLVADTGKVEILNVRNPVVIDGISYEKTGEAAAALQGGLLHPVIYKTNSKEEIIMLDTILKGNGDEKDMLTQTVEQFDGRYKNSTQVFEGRMAIDNDTRIFFIPAEPETARNGSFGCGNARYFQNDTMYYRMSGYARGDENIIADVVVLRDTTMTNSGGIFVYEGKIKSLDNEGTERTEICVRNGEGEERYPLESEKVTEQLYGITVFNQSADTMEELDKAISLQKGDVIKCVYDKEGKVIKIGLIYSPTSEKMYSINPYFHDFHMDTVRYIVGKPEQIQDGVIKMPIINNGVVERYEYYKISGSPVLMFDKERANRETGLHSGNVMDISLGDTVLMVSKGGTPSYTVIFH